MIRWILGILILLGLLIWRTRIGIRISLAAECAAAEITIGLFRIRLMPAKDHPPAKKKAVKKKTPPPKEGVAKKLPKPTWDELKEAWRILSPACRRALGRTRRSIRVNPLQLSLTIAGEEDPAAAAESYGYAHAAVWTVMPALEQLLVIPDPHVHIGVDFEAEKTRVEGQFGVSIRIGTLIAVGLEVGIPALRWFCRVYKRHRRRPDTPQEKNGAAMDTAA